MDGLELAENFRDEIEQYGISLEIHQRSANKKLRAPEKPLASIKFLGRNIFEHVLLHLKRIRSSELENTLRYLNQKQAFALMFYLEHFLRNHVEIELVTRAILFLAKSYQVQIKQDASMLPLIKSISLHMKQHFKELRDEVGINVCALKVVQKEVREQRTSGEAAGLDFSKPSFDF